MDKETLFALSLFPYLGFLWFMTKSKLVPRLAMVGFYVLLVFVAVTIPAGIYAQVHYGEELANVDWLHGSAEAFLSVTNILVAWGFKQAINRATEQQQLASLDQNQRRPLLPALLIANAIAPPSPKFHLSFQHHSLHHRLKLPIC